MPYRIILVKLLPQKYASDFLDGNLYLNTNSFFGQIERADAVRFDPHDGVDESRQVLEVAIQDEKGTWLPLPIIGPVTSRTELSDALNVLCFYTVTDRSGDFFDGRNIAFGDVAVVIGDIKEFILRVKTAAKAASKEVFHGPIHYVERDIYDGPMGPFRKYTEYQYQNEFRFVLNSGTGAECRLAIGDLRDIAYPIRSTDLSSLWERMLKN